MSNTVFQTYPSNIIHDIYLRNSVGDFFNIIISEMANGACNVDVISRRPQDNISSINNFNNQKSYTGAFDTAIEFIKTCFKGAITDIDNPCNTPFISKTDQEVILSRKGINVTVTVNGK
ncbi:hypothetical protein [Serratia ureilytica]|uniref:Uncharacterized protein n=1 Tax=Serratia ureilytica TaxID=300181 RepID=A0A9X9G519_9GAMM|nr:hypothetical protein [Serratia ureilytica]TXE33046.1 hypothetical protein FOT63_03025 [Serratia ureilytica]